MGEVKKSNASFAVAGLCGAFLFAVIWFVAAFNDGWVFAEDLFCDLGKSLDSTSSDLFHYGLILTGLLLAYLGIGKVLRESKANCVAGVFATLIGLCLVIVGGFVLDANADIHETALNLAIVLAILASALSAAADFKDGNTLSGAASAIISIGIIAACVSLDFAFIESWTMLLLMLWMITESLKVAFVAPTN